MVDVSFDDATHTYTLNGVVQPSVTQILLAMELYKGHEFMTDEHATRGKYVHLACELLDRDDLDETDLDESLRGYVEAYKKFKVESGFKPELIEYRVCSRIYGFAGTLDRTGTINEIYCILDIKSGVKQPCDALQTAAYMVALGEEKGWEKKVRCQRYALYLGKDETYKLEQHANHTDKDVFLSALAVCKYKKENGLI
ncbi:MAG: PD-(D/E)XK nuclease family protein [Nitrospirae bacterium]|uniref:PD-(D/E)XK nuclease family protein n=1 Tax=Candidatus Magnetobacterium casense TaxID=1455061 RepID=UPI00058C5410|nr:PD-(D/E)XK nuclease family protein [Candidatus Magnetobacterium casensis]MBF0336928.1 PD-(D/E)XK nuclease family protein [Nitrospirota bacterium]